MKATVPRHVKEAEGKALQDLVVAYKPGRDALIAASGVSGSYLSQMISAHRPINLARATALATALGVKIESFSPRLALLAASAGASEAASISNVAPFEPSGLRPAPRITWVQAGRLEEFVDPYPTGGGESFEMVDASYGPRVVALVIKGDSMEDRFHEGDVIIVDPDLTPRPGEFVVAKNHQDEATFKKYRPRGTSESGEMVFELAPLNSDYPTLYSDRDHLRIIGVMVEHRSKARRR